MRVHSIWAGAAFTLIIALSLPCVALAQAKFDDDRVLLQGFYWESYRHGHPGRFPQLGSKKWYEIVRENASKIREGRFNLVWLPPSSYSGEVSAGYNPKQYFNPNNSYGSFAQHRALLDVLLANGMEPVADIVINHRDGTGGWARFENPDWGLWAVCRSDEAFTRQDSDVRGTPENLRGGKRPHGSLENQTPEGFARRCALIQDAKTRLELSL